MGQLVGSMPRISPRVVALSTGGPGRQPDRVATVLRRRSSSARTQHWPRRRNVMTELYESREGDPVERYLDELLPLLPGHPGDVRRALAEVEDHLRESKSQAMAQGADEQSASMQAVERFGTPAEVARKFRSARPALDARTVRAVVRSLWLLGAIGFISIGFSGLIAAAFGAIGGKGFVS